MTALAVPKRLLFVPPTSTVRLTEHWHVVKDGDTAAKELHLRHYSAREYRDGRQPALFVGPGEPMFTYVDPCKVASSNPGYCFQRAGWERIGRTASGLHVLRKEVQ